MSTPVDHLRMKVWRLEDRVTHLARDEEALNEAVRKIDIDLSNTIAEFAATTGRPEEEFWPWRRKAKQARFYKVKAAKAKRDELMAARQELTNAQMLLYATESGYRGDNLEGLLRALYHLMMEVLSSTQYRIDDHQLGLIAAVRDRTEKRPEGVIQ